MEDKEGLTAVPPRSRTLPPDEDTGGVTPLPAWSRARPPDDAVCPRCGRPALAAAPAFSTGSGIASRPCADDVFCRRCSYLGPLYPEP